ncbi:EAL domain-containing protein [Comamonas sp. GB3 AK4-5]|uniref:bifunctional diguanylate cyclase/phosphodiesterase n=1 Tax=Comamonas sp. GB3 AK4-5 TaxID=3231487 RepID=UPI00351DE66E
MVEGIASASLGGLHGAQWQALDRVMAIAAFALDGSLCRANSRYLDILRLTQEQAENRSYQSFCTPQDAAQFRHFWARLCSGVTHSGVVERVRGDGSRCWLEATYAPVHDTSGQVVQILKVATDITERRAQEQQQQEHLQRLSLVADATDSAVMISDGHSRILYVNGGFTRMLGWRSEELAEADPIPLLVPQMPEEFAQTYRGALRAGQPVGREEVVVGKQGQRYWAKVTSNPIVDADGHWRYTITVLTDITRAKMHEVLQHRVLEAMARERPLTEVLELVCREVERIAPEVAVSILEVDANQCLRALAGPSLPAAYSQQVDGMAVGPKAGSCGTAAWRNTPVRVDDISTDPLWSGYQHLVQMLGYRSCWSSPIRNGEGEVVATFALYFRETLKGDLLDFHQQLMDACTHLCTLALERERARARIRQLAFYDSLTGLPNRSLLQARAEQAIASAARNEEQLAVLFIDLDRFKQVNDSLGHSAGDELLCHVASRLQEVLRASDIAGRLSGDEFVVVLPQCDAEHVTYTIERLQGLLAASLQVADATLAVSASIGIAMYPADGRDMETLLQRADMAMYQAKSGGRGSFSFYSSEMNQLVQERLALELALRDALQKAALQLHYQPQVDLETGQLYGVEALARWTHAELGEISPARFIPLAEECGLIAELGRWALGEACRQLAQWRAQGLMVPAVSVNLSPTSFHNLDLPRMIADTLDHHALAPQDLTLELTESVLLDTNPSTMKTIAEVHAKGVRLSMDDFGTGYSSLSYLRRLPVSELKLDRSFVADLEHDATAQALSRAILGIGQSLHLTVVAEGVETPVQNAMLHEQGYPVAQGFLFSRPLAPQDLEHWLHQRQQGGPEPAPQSGAS